MRVTFKELMDSLGVGYELSAYETCPWSVYDGEKAATCSAEVRMNHDGDEIEAEIQMMHDTPPESGAPIERKFYALYKPSADQKWEAKKVIALENDGEGVYDWATKAASFFHACVQALKMDQIPDFEALYEQEITSKEKYAGGRGGSSKAPKIKPQQLLDMKQGRGF